MGGGGAFSPVLYRVFLSSLVSSSLLLYLLFLFVLLALFGGSAADSSLYKNSMILTSVAPPLRHNYLGPQLPNSVIS